MIPTKVLRWIVGVVAGVLLLLAAQCRGEHLGRANAVIDFNDSLAKVDAKRTADFDKIRATDAARFLDSLTKLAQAKASADSQVARANRSIGRITIIGPAKAPRGETTISGEVSSESDTTAYVGIQRQGDVQTYTVPKFAVDAVAELQKALTAKEREALVADGALDLARLTIRNDSNVIRSQAEELTHRMAAENAAKQKAGGGCRVLFIPCPSRTLTFIGGSLLGAIAGYELAKR